jgi:phosphonate transport system permease protein
MSEATDHPAYRLFAARQADLRRARRSETLLSVAIVGLLILVSVIDTEFYPSRILAGVPRIGEYFGKLFSVVPQRGADPVPVLALAHLFGGVKEPQSLAYWFYRVGTYATLLWQTIQMAVLATVMGFTGAFALSFPAAHNLVCHRPVLWLTRRVLEVMRSIPQVVLAFILSGRSASARSPASSRSASIPRVRWENCSPR